MIVGDMNILSSPSSTSKLTPFSTAQNPDSSNFHFYTFRIFHSSHSHRILLPLHSHESSSSSPILQEKPHNSAPNDEESEIEDEGGFDEEITTAKKSLEDLLVVRRPVMEFIAEESEAGPNSIQKEPAPSASVIDERLSRFAKNMPIFEPERVGSSSGKRPLMVNLDLALYKAKMLTRNYRFAEAEEILVKCISYWPEDGRPYVTLGKTLSKQSKMDEARAVYEKGSQATQGENSFIWQCWAVFESKMGNIRRSRELFDAATVADKKHVAAWHGWAVLEMKQGNVKKARSLLGKALKYCRGNEYVYQTLALLEVKGKRYEQARHLFRQATKCNPQSCASWLAWAQLEAQLENHRAARSFFEKAVQASPKNRFAWHVWGVFEANLGNADLARKLLKVGHTVNPRDPVLLQSLGLLEYRYSTANLARALFLRASELDPTHQPVWIAWGWMEWKEGNLVTARELYQKALSINSTTESAARCLQAWGVLEQRAGNLSAARRLFRSSLNVNSQSYVTWMTWATLEENQGNSVRAEEIRNLYFQQRTEITDDTSWMMGFMDIIDPAVDSIKRLLKMEKADDSLMGSMPGEDDNEVSKDALNSYGSGTGFDLDEFIREKLLLDPKKLEVHLGTREGERPKKAVSARKTWRLESQSKNVIATPKL